MRNIWTSPKQFICGLALITVTQFSVTLSAYAGDTSSTSAISQADLLNAVDPPPTPPVELTQVRSKHPNTSKFVATSHTQSEAASGFEEPILASETDIDSGNDSVMSDPMIEQAGYTQTVLVSPPQQAGKRSYNRPSNQPSNRRPERSQHYRSNMHRSKFQETIVEGPTWSDGSEIQMDHQTHSGNDCCGDSCCQDSCGRWIGPDQHDCVTGWSCNDSCSGWRWWQDLSFFSGPHGFTGPLDLGVNGNFGFHFGVNWTFPLWHRFGIGTQLGAQVQSSNFSGDMITPGVSNQRTQTFVTAGIFRRPWPKHCGWQWGVAVDWLNDSYYEDLTHTQVRGELSWHLCKHHELGVMGAAGIQQDSLLDDNEVQETEVISQFSLFYRYNFDSGAEGRIWGGGTGEGDGLFGGDMYVPISSYFALQTDFNYLIPKEGNNQMGVLQEAWYVGFNFVWYPSGCGMKAHRSRYRPLFNVANNGSMLINRP